MEVLFLFLFCFLIEEVVNVNHLAVAINVEELNLPWSPLMYL